MNDNQIYNSGVDGTTLLGLTFIVLKLTHVINWSWWWVTAPFWIPFAILLIVVIILGIAAIFTKT